MGAADSASRQGQGSGDRPISKETDLWTGLLVVAVGAIGLLAAFDVREPSALSGYIGPRVFPIGVSSLLVVLGCLLVAKALLRPAGEEPDLGDRKILVVMVGAVTAYLLLFMAVGFPLTTFLLLAGLFMFLGERRKWLAVTLGAAFSVAVYYGFTYGLNVALPSGLLGF